MVMQVSKQSNNASSLTTMFPSLAQSSGFKHGTGHVGGQSLFSTVKKASALLLLATGGAAARALHEPASATLPLGHQTRRLTQSCPSWSTPHGDASQEISSLPASVQTVASSQRWVETRAFCQPTLATHGLTLGYTFDGSYATGATAAVDADTQQSVQDQFLQISNNIGIEFVVQDPTSAENQPPLTIAPQGSGGLLESVLTNAWNATAPRQGSMATTLIGPLSTVNPNVAGPRNAAILQALGLSYYTAANAATQLGGFADNTLSTAMSSTANACVNVTDIGPLDLAALAYKYGLNDDWSEDGTFTVYDSSPFVGGLIFSGTANNNTLAINTQTSRAQISLADDGSSATFSGNNVAMLAPGSVVANADLTQTQGGIVVGSNLTNTMFGSDGDDTFMLGSGLTTVKGGGGDDNIVVRFPNSAVYFDDYTASDTIYVPGAPSFTSFNATFGGMFFTFDGNKTVHLPNVAWGTSVPVFSTLPFVTILPVPCAFQKPVSSSSPPPPSPIAAPPPPPSPVTSPPPSSPPPAPAPPSPASSSSSASSSGSSIVGIIGGIAAGLAVTAAGLCLVGYRRKWFSCLPSMATVPGGLPPQANAELDNAHFPEEPRVLEAEWAPVEAQRNRPSAPEYREEV